MSNWIRAGMVVMAAVLWLAYWHVWVDWNGHRPTKPDEAHRYAYGGHTGPFYVSLSELTVLRALNFGSIGLLAGAAFVGRNPRKPSNKSN